MPISKAGTSGNGLGPSDGREDASSSVKASIGKLVIENIGFDLWITVGNSITSQWGDSTTITFLGFYKGPKLLGVAIFTRDNVFNIIVVGFPAVELGLLLKILVLLHVLARIGLLGSAIGFFLPSGEPFHIPVYPWLAESGCGQL